MATTTNYGWTTPDNTDLVKDGASAIRTLGSAIDSTLKTQIDAQIPDSLLTTTGDIIYASGASTPARLGVGSTGQVLSVSGGVPAWAAPSGNDSALTPEEATYYVTNRASGATLSNFSTTVLSTTYYTPIFLPSGSFNRITFSTSASFTTAGNTRLGLYNCSLTTGKPTTVVFDAGVVNATAASTIYEITISQTTTAGWYYFAINRQSGDYGIQAFGQQSTGLNTISSTITNATVMAGYTEASITGAFATAGTLAVMTNSRNPVVGMRIA
jgi:hypothetical protein